jgi:general secretion pathway protein F
MIAVGERSGELEAMLGKVADGYEQEVESTLGTLTAILEPITIVVMGGIVLFIVLAILLPIFEINALVR